MSHQTTPHQPNAQEPHRWCPILHRVLFLLYCGCAAADILTSPDEATAVRRALMLIGCAAVSLLASRSLRGRPVAADTQHGTVHVRRRWARVAAATDATYAVLLSAGLIGILTSPPESPTSDPLAAVIGLSICIGLITLGIVSHRHATAYVPNPQRRR